jgi:hypothetical protein
MQWLEKGNEQCPYCRKDMMTAEDLYEAAREELGEARVEKIKRVNEESARRLAAYHLSIGSLMVMQGIEQPTLIGTVSSPATIRGDDRNNRSRGGNTEETSAGRSSTNPIAPADTISNVPLQ